VNLGLAQAVKILHNLAVCLKGLRRYSCCGCSGTGA